MSNKFPGKVGFAIGTGRCGTTFLYRAMSEEPNIAASHERNHLLENFHKYCSWNELPVDEEGFLAEKEREINEDLGWAEFSFESSGHLSFSVPALSGRFQARFVLLVRNPLRVVSSYVHKGYYEQPFRQQKTDLALGFQPGREFHHFLGRVAPRHEEFRRWNEMTQVGKVAWFWKALNQRSLQLLEQLPTTDWTLIRLEDLNFARYQSLTQMFGFESQLAADDFDQLRQQRPNSSSSSLRIPEWSDREISEFEQEIGDLSARLGYPSSFADCVDQASTVASAEKKSSKRPGRSFYARLGLSG
ncbi:MAG: hypothetical protein P8N76_19230 [Pirellulaceae bacterium]|nr:hypothetical protein [Pirellulaceae bacterium]